MTNKPQKYAELIKAWADGATIEQRDPNVMLLSLPPQPDTWRPFNGDWIDAMEYRIKPEPVAPSYPETHMTEDELIKFISAHPRLTTGRVAVKLANAAIARAIGDGQVVPVEHVPNLRMVPLGVVRDVAHAVLESACQAATTRLVRETGVVQMGPISLPVNCDAIIERLLEKFI